MSDMNVEVTLAVRDKATAILRRVVAGAKEIKRALDSVNRSGANNGRERALNREAVVARKLRMEYGKLAIATGKLRNAAKGLLARGGIIAGAAIAYTGMLASASMTFLQPAIDMEKFRMQLEQLEGSAEKGRQAIAWISDFAVRTPLELPQVISAYAALKNMGIDPMNGSLQALVDTMAMSGRGMENLDSIILAVGQAWTKQKLQGDDARQLLEAGVPVWDLLSKKLGKSSKAIMDMASKGKLGRREIALLIEAMGERAAGASDRFSKTWEGLFSNISDAWFRFRVMVADSGPFQELKNWLQGILDTISKMEKEGTLKAFAEHLGGQVTTALKNCAAAARGFWEAAQLAFGVIDRIAAAAGGYRNLAYFAAGLFLAGSAAKVVVAAGQAAVILARIAALGGLGTAGSLIAVAGGLGLIAGALLLIQSQSTEWMDKLENLRLPEQRAKGKLNIDPNKDLIAGGLVGQEAPAKAGAIANEYIMAKVVNPLKAAWHNFDMEFQKTTALIRFKAKEFVVQLAANVAAGAVELWDAGVKLVQSLWEGMKARFAEFVAWVKTIPRQIIDAIGRIDLSGMISWPSLPSWMGGGSSAAPAAKGSANPAGKGDLPSGIKPRAQGGSMFPGSVYRIAERDAEIVTPSRAAAITPLHKLMGQGGGRTVNVGPITINGSVDKGNVQRLAELIAQRVRAGLHDGAYAT